MESRLTPRQVASISGAQLLPSIAEASPKLIVCAAAMDGAAISSTNNVERPRIMVSSDTRKSPMVKGCGATALEENVGLDMGTRSRSAMRSRFCEHFGPLRTEGAGK